MRNKSDFWDWINLILMGSGGTSRFDESLTIQLVIIDADALLLTKGIDRTHFCEPWKIHQIVASLQRKQPDIFFCPMQRAVILARPLKVNREKNTIVSSSNPLEFQDSICTSQNKKIFAILDFQIFFIPNQRLWFSRFEFQKCDFTVL